MSALKLRNPVAQAPLLRKGGAHIKTKSSQRTQVRKEINRSITDWKISKISKLKS